MGGQSDLILSVLCVVVVVVLRLLFVCTNRRDRHRISFRRVGLAEETGRQSADAVGGQ